MDKAPLYRSFVSWYNAICQFLLLFPGLVEHLGNHCLGQHTEVLPLCFPPVASGSQVLHWVDYFNEVRGMDLVHPSTCGYPVFPAPFFKVAVFPNLGIWQLGQESDGVDVWVSFWVLYSMPFLYMSVFYVNTGLFLLPRLCSVFWNQVSLSIFIFSLCVPLPVRWASCRWHAIGGCL